MALAAVFAATFVSFLVVSLFCLLEDNDIFLSVGMSLLCLLWHKLIYVVFQPHSVLFVSYSEPSAT